MRTRGMIAALAAVLALAGVAVADDTTTVAKQKDSAAANWKKLDLGDAAIAETAHLLVYANLPEAKVKAAAAALEKQYATAHKALKFGDDEKPWDGKLTVYLFAERSQFGIFVRQVEKRSPMGDETASLVVRTDPPHVAAGASRAGAAPERGVGPQIAAALLKRKAGSSSELPGYVLSGFGEATVYRSGASASPGRPNPQWRGRLSVKLLTEPNLPQAQVTLLGSYLMDYMAYGPGAVALTEFLDGFIPEEAKPMKSLADALESAKASWYSVDTWTRPAVPKTKPAKPGK